MSWLRLGLCVLLSIWSFCPPVTAQAEPAPPQLVLTRTNAPPVKRMAAVVPLHGVELKFDQPTCVTALPGASNTLVVLEQLTGHLWLLETPPAGARRRLFAQLGKAEGCGPWEGFLSVTFHPRFEENRRYFVKRDVVAGDRRHTVILELAAGADGRADSGKPARELLRVPMASENHHGGFMCFGPDGRFYTAFGDGGPQEDPNGHAQDERLLLGKLLRLDLDQVPRGRTYGIPKDNPFVRGGPFLPEVWAAGFREPWRFAVDPVTGDVWVGDVGQLRFEEVCRVRAGENHGWNVFEAFEPFSDSFRRAERRFTPPVLAYGRDFGVSVTGGIVYRARPDSPFFGAFLFGDYVMRQIWAVWPDTTPGPRVRQIGIAHEALVSFGQDARGEPLLVGQGGTICRLDLGTVQLD